MDIRGRRVGDVMQTQIAVMGPDERLDLANDIMRLGRVRHIPVVDDERLVGMLSSHDVMAASLARVFDIEESHRRTFLRSVDVKEVMSEPVATVSPDATLQEAATIVVARKIGALAVVETGDRLVGLITASDLIRAALLDESGDQEETDVSDIEDRIEREVKELRRVRDELRVRMHLAKAEVKDLWDALEHKFERAESHARRVSREAGEEVEEIGAAARLLLDEIRAGYRRIRDAL